ncbi:2-hydroxyacid dehydrogenase [Mycoplasma sp. Ms02]|uniref:2-hydroxyacid dehydrogenase n=1 Tax=Mycoplasma sp. Ms02 TaxID=353851 RepID=UPI001C8A3DE4|nr:2-hydroxyacid dehydrogenase [Mycoplasma sp. Ms02]QZE12611.1 2-hydroxyacid dehydrogenase [Mycoplasma sp. Ms02]
MKIAFFDAKEYDKKYFDSVNNGRHEIVYFEENLNLNTVQLTKGFDAVCGFVNTYGDKYVLELLAKFGVKFWFQRSMGYNKVDLATAAKLGIEVFRVPNYSAESVAEFAMTSLLALNRNIVKASSKVKKYDFTLSGLDGKTVFGSTFGVIGSGKIGQAFIKIAKGFGAKVLVFDIFSETNFPHLAQELGFEYASLNRILKEADFMSLHAPLLPSTKYLLDAEAVKVMKPGMLIVNSARGELMDLQAMIDGLKSGVIAGLATDVLEREEGRFYEDISDKIEEYKKIDPQWYELIQMDNVVVTSHQAFLTNVALTQIAKITLENADDAQKGDFSKALKLLESGRVQNG